MNVNDVIPKLPIDALIYDCEIRHAIPDKDKPRLPGIIYCNGWGDYAGMGVSVIGAYDYAEQRYRIFLKDSFAKFAELCANRKLLISYNGIPFDNKLLAGNGITKIDEVKCYDLLKESWPSKYKSSTLSAMCQTNFGISKSGSGAHAPILWQQGKYGEVIDYCLNDIYLIKRLFDAILEGPIKCPRTGEFLTLTRPILHVVNAAGSAQQGTGSKEPAADSLPATAAIPVAAGPAKSAGPASAAKPVQS